MTEFRLIDNPTVCPSGYSFHAYCKYENPDHDYAEFPHMPTGCETKRQAITQLRAEGWRIHRDETATCPKCMARLKALGVS